MGFDGSRLMRKSYTWEYQIDLAPYVGASLEVMESDTQRMRGDKPFVFSNLKSQEGLPRIIDFIVSEGMLRRPN